MLVRESVSLGAQLLTDNKVTQVAVETAGFSVQTTLQMIHARRLVIATGGVSWPQTGSMGDGYRFAESLGHAVTPPRACLAAAGDSGKLGGLAGRHLGRQGADEGDGR